MARPQNRGFRCRFVPQMRIRVTTEMKRQRIDLLTAAGDTPAPNVTIYGIVIVEEANRRFDPRLQLTVGFHEMTHRFIPVPHTAQP